MVATKTLNIIYVAFSVSFAVFIFIFSSHMIYHWNLILSVSLYSIQKVDSEINQLDNKEKTNLFLKNRGIIVCPKYHLLLMNKCLHNIQNWSFTNRAFTAGTLQLQRTFEASAHMSTPKEYVKWY